MIRTSDLLVRSSNVVLCIAKKLINWLIFGDSLRIPERRSVSKSQSAAKNFKRK